MPITLQPPQTRRRLGAVDVWAILATEAMPAQNGEAIEWLLLTTVPAHGVDDAIERVHWYTCRWTIEVWHRVLNSSSGSLSTPFWCTRAAPQLPA